MMDNEFEKNIPLQGNGAAEVQDEDAYEPVSQTQSDPVEQDGVNPNAARFEPSGEYRWSRPTPPVQEGQTEKTKKAKKKKSWPLAAVIAVSVCCGLLSGVAGAAVFGLCSGRSEKNEHSSNVYQGDRESTVLNTNMVNTGKLMTQSEVYAANVRATVGIIASVTTNYWGYQTTSPASGSGFFYTDDGYVLTNYHVIEDASSVSVSTYDGQTLPAAIVGYDESNDIAVLKVEAQGVTPVTIGSSDNLNVGDGVVAIGNPLGELTFSLTAGYVSALNREVTLSGGVTMNLIQTDCAINSGNSGGALFNLYGEVIGITNAKYSGLSGSGATIDNIGFAIPIDQVRSIVDSIIEKGYVVNPYIGVSVKDVSSETVSYGLPQGAAVVSVEQDGPAQNGGLAANDIITHINGEEITGSSELKKAVLKSTPGDVLNVTVWRKGATIELTITVGEQIQSNQTQQESQSQQYGFPFFGWGN